MHTTIKQPSLVLLLLLLALGSGMLYAAPSHSQETPPTMLVRGNGEWSLSQPSSAPQLVATAQFSETARLYLPTTFTQTGVVILFGSGLDTSRNLIDQGTTFAYGINALYYRYEVFNAQGLPYRAEWWYNNIRQPQLDDSGTILSSQAVFTNHICTLDLSTCSDPVPAGTYSVDFYIDDLLVQQASAVVQ